MDKLIPDPPVPPMHLDIAADANAERVIDSYLNPKPAQPDKKSSPDLLFTEKGTDLFNCAVLK